MSCEIENYECEHRKDKECTKYNMGCPDLYFFRRIKERLKDGN